MSDKYETDCGCNCKIQIRKNQFYLNVSTIRTSKEKCSCNYTCHIEIEKKQCILDNQIKIQVDLILSQLYYMLKENQKRCACAGCQDCNVREHYRDIEMNELNKFYTFLSDTTKTLDLNGSPFFGCCHYRCQKCHQCFLADYKNKQRIIEFDRIKRALAFYKDTHAIEFEWKNESIGEPIQKDDPDYDKFFDCNKKYPRPSIQDYLNDKQTTTLELFY